jgi:hypothetical protein
MNAFVSLVLILALAPSVTLADHELARVLLAQVNDAPPAEGDGQRDFDFSFGTWRTEVRVRPPLSDAEWSEYVGTSVVRPIWDGRANLVELDVSGPAGSIVGLSLRLYDPQARRWSLHYANARTAELTPPVIGAFTNGVGEFTSTEELDGREVLVKFVITQEAPDRWRYVQLYSGDGGASWEPNWIAIDTLIDRATD